MTKRKKYRHPVFSEKTAELIKLWIPRKNKKRFPEKADYLFDLKPEGVYQALSDVGRRLGIKTNPHSFRRGLTVALLESGLGIEDVKNIMGHEDIKTTQIYSGEYEEKKSQKRYVSPIAGLNLDKLFEGVGLPTMKNT